MCLKKAHQLSFQVLQIFLQGEGCRLFVSFAAKKKRIDKGVVQPGECRYEQRKLEANSAASLISPCKKPEREVNKFTSPHRNLFILSRQKPWQKEVCNG